MAFRHFAFTAGLAAASLAGAAMAEELPAPKAGLWETKIIGGEGGMAPMGGYKQCMDGQISMETLMKMTGGMCDLKWKRTGADRIETETNCKMGHMSAEGHGVIVGDFNTMVRVESKTRISMAGMPTALATQEQSMVMEVRWVGPCEPGQKPGDTIMPDGRVVNMKDVQRMHGAMPK
jgi:hypothetical protein